MDWVNILTIALAAIGGSLGTFLVSFFKEKRSADLASDNQSAQIKTAQNSALAALGSDTAKISAIKQTIAVATDDQEALTKLSTLPGRDALLGQFLGTLMGAEYGLVGTLNANFQKLVYVLSEASKK